MTKDSENLLLHALINQLETDFDDNEYESMDELLTQLMKNKTNHKILIGYLSDKTKECWLDGKTSLRF